jgi:hypothetical protein
MNIYLLKQDINTGYDTYDSCVVAAPSEAIAATITPSGNAFTDECWSDWAYTVEDVQVILIGTAKDWTQQGVILASFNAG